MTPIVNASSAGITSVTQLQDRGYPQGTAGNGWSGRLVSVCSDATAFLGQALSDAPNPGYYLLKKPAVMLCGGMALVAGAGGTQLSQPGLSANSSAPGNPDPARLIPATFTGYPNTPEQAAADGESPTTLDQILHRLPDQAREISGWSASESDDPDATARNRKKRQASDTGLAAASKRPQLTYTLPINPNQANSTSSYCAPHRVVSISWSPDSDRMALGIGSGQDSRNCPYSGSVQIVKMTSETTSPVPVRTLADAGSWVHSVTWSPDGTLLAAGGFERNVRVYNGTAPGNPLYELTEATDAVWSVTWSPDGTLLAAGGGDQVVRIYNGTAPDSLLRNLTDATDQVKSVTWSPDGTLLAAGGSNTNVRIYNGTAPGAPLYELPESSWVESVTWSPDGTLLAAGESDTTVRIYNGTAPGAPLRTLTDATDWVRTVTWSPDGTLLAAGGDDTEVRIYNGTAPGDPLYTLTESTSYVHSATWSPDGQWLAVGGEDGELRIYKSPSTVIRENTKPATATVTTENTKPTTATKSTTDSAVCSSTKVDPTQCLRTSHGPHDHYDNGCAQRKCSDLAQQHNTTKILCIDKIHSKALCQNATKATIETCKSEHKVVEIIPLVGPEQWCDGRTNAPSTPDFPKGSDEAVELCTLEKCEELNKDYGRILCGEDLCVEHTQDGINHCVVQGRTVKYF